MTYETQEEQEQTDTDGDTDDGNDPSSNSIVERADAIAERLAKENARFEANIRRQEEIMAKQALGGISGGPKQPEKPKEETPREYAQRLSRGII